MLGKYYKPNTKSLLYLNSSFNCRKSSSITLTIKSGSSYREAPAIIITTAPGDTGSGAAATCSLVPTQVQFFTVVNRGSGYAVGDVLNLDNTGTGMQQSASAYVYTVGTGGAIGSIFINYRGSYTIKAPKVVSVTSVNGTGAQINVVLFGSVPTNLVMTNNGSGYTKLPTVTVSAGNAVIEPSFLKTYSYTWNVPDIEINDLAKLSALNIVATGTNSTAQYTYKITNLLYDSRNSHFSDYGAPILSLAQNTNIANRGALGAGEHAIILTPQTIKEITLTVDDDITKKGSGQSANINFVIALKIEEFNPTYREKTDVYEEAAANRLRPHF